MSLILFPSLCLRVLWWPSRDVWMCHGWRWRVCSRVSVRFIFVCVRVRVVVSLGKVHNRAAQRSLSREEVGEGHSQPLSLIIWASSMMNLPSLYFWLLSNACSCNRQKQTKCYNRKKKKTPLSSFSQIRKYFCLRRNVMKKQDFSCS